MKKIFIKLLILVLIIQTSFNLIDIIFKPVKAVNKIYVPKGGTYTFTASTSTYTLGDSSIASVSTGTPYSYTSAALGSDRNYDESEVDLEECLYTFKTSGTMYRINRGKVYMVLGRKSSNGVYTYYVNSTSNAKVTYTNSNGEISFSVASIYLCFNSNKYITCLYGSSNKSTFNLYKPVEAEETSSTELPGYIKVNSITSGKQYLIVKKDGDDYYLVYPSTSTSNNYSQTAKVVTKTGVEYTITGNHVGTTTLTIDGKEYEITVYDENTILEPDSNFIDKALTIGMGTSYTINTNTSELVWTSNDTSIATVTAGGRVTPVSVGETTLTANMNGAKYEFRVRVIDGATSGLLVNILVDSDDDTIPYYNPNFGNTFYELKNGERVYCYMSDSSYRAVDFWGKPKNGYVLSHMYAASGYTAITNNTATEAENGESTNIINLQVNGLGASLVSTGITRALNNGIEGMAGFSRIASVVAEISDTMTFRSEELSANISQEIYSINGSSYSSGDEANPGDTVIFKITVSKTSNDEKLVVYEGTLTNSLSGAVFIGTSPTGTGTATSQSVTISSDAPSSQTYYVKYVVPNSASDNITNTASFAYSTYADEAYKTASYKIERQTLTDTLNINSGGTSASTHITVTKEVAGNMRETDKYFKFLVTINGTNGATYRISGQDSTVMYNNSQVNTSSTYTVGSTNYIYLKDGQTVNIGLANDNITEQIPIGVTYSIVEQDAEDYITTISGIQGETKTTGNLTTQNSDNIVEFLNSKDAAALTGQNFSIMYYLAIFVGSILFLFIIYKIIRKNRYKLKA